MGDASFGYGLDYRGALRVFTAVAGKIAMVPRYTVGVWWTRWFDLNSHDVRKVILCAWLMTRGHDACG